MDKLDSGGNGNLKYKVYLEERKSLIEAKFEGSRLFDKAILTLTAGAFGLSLTFIRQAVPDLISGTAYMLICAWIGFGVSLFSTLISFFTSQSACLRQIKILEETFCNHSGQEKKDDPKNKATGWTKGLNIFSIFAFIFGAVFLVIFSIVNLLS